MADPNMAHQAGPRLELGRPSHIPQIDTLRALFTYGLVWFVVGGGLLILFLTRGETSSSDLRIVIAGFIGSALTFAFGGEVQTRTARQSALSTEVATAANVAAAAASNSGVGTGIRNGNGTP